MFKGKCWLYALLAGIQVGLFSFHVHASTGKLMSPSKKTGFVAIPPERIKEGRQKLTGDRSPNDSEARKSWHRRCEAWLQKIQRDLAKERLLMITCSSPVCTGTSPSKSCSSNGIYKFADKPQSELPRTAKLPSNNTASKK